MKDGLAVLSLIVIVITLIVALCGSLYVDQKKGLKQEPNTKTLETYNTIIFILIMVLGFINRLMLE